MRQFKYRLVGHEPVVEPDVHAWADWFDRATGDRSRVVAQTTVGNRMVSTVFTGIDYDFSGMGAPLVFETMVFPGGTDERRYPTWELAEEGHLETVARLKRHSFS